MKVGHPMYVSRIIYIYKEDCLSVSVLLSQCIRTVFKVRSSNFSDRSRTSGAGRGGVDDSTVPRRGQE